MPDPGTGMTRCYSTHPYAGDRRRIPPTSVTCSRSVYLPCVDTNRRGTTDTDAVTRKQQDALVIKIWPDR